MSGFVDDFQLAVTVERLDLNRDLCHGSRTDEGLIEVRVLDVDVLSEIWRVTLSETKVKVDRRVTF